MARAKNTNSPIVQSIRTFAMRLPNVEEDIACAGTPVECAKFQVRKKSFLFVARDHFRLKLGDSLAEASKLARRKPERFSAGARGWVKVTFAANNSPPLDIVSRWIDESYRLHAPKPKASILPSSQTKQRAT